MDDKQLLVLMAPIDIKDDIVDALIGCKEISGFNMSTTAGYSREHSQYDLSEQVRGHRQFFKFEVMHDRQQQADLLAVLRPACASGEIRYWITPLLEQGHF